MPLSKRAVTSSPLKNTACGRLPGVRATSGVLASASSSAVVCAQSVPFTRMLPLPLSSTRRVYVPGTCVVRVVPRAKAQRVSDASSSRSSSARIGTRRVGLSFMATRPLMGRAYSATTSAVKVMVAV